MSRRTVVIIAAATSSILAIIAVMFFVFHIGNPFKSRASSSNPKIDAKWTVIYNDGSTYKIKLSVHSLTASENMGSSNFVIKYNEKGLNYSKSPVNGVDYSFVNFTDWPYLTPTVTHPEKNLIFVNIVFNGRGGTSISNGFVDVCTLTFAINDPFSTPNITWANSKPRAPMLNDVYNDKNVNFDEGNFSAPANNPLLVSHLQLSASLNYTTAKLAWTTSAELNTKYFTIQRSRDSIHFDSIQTDASAGASKFTQSYLDSDSRPLTGVSYYRVILTDEYGNKDTSNIASIDNKNSGINTNGQANGAFAITSISPTTFQQSTNINYTMPRAGNVRMVVVNTGGKTIMDIEVPSAEGENTYRLLNAGTWQPGLYVVTMYFDGQSAFGKMIKQ